MIPMEKEIRSYSIEYNSNDSRTIEGYSIVFNSLSHDLGGFREIISPEALDGVLEKSDVTLLINHDSTRGILGRSKNGKGSLHLTVDDKGLRFMTEAPKTALGDEVLEYLRRGDATQCSFAFTVADDGDSWVKGDDDIYIRTITKFDRIFDCSILTCTPAYEETSCSCARFLEIQEADKKALEEQREKEEREAQEKRDNELKEYFENLRNDNEKYLKADNK